MKAFEEWWLNYIIGANDKWHLLMLEQMKPIYVMVWKAALKWALAQATDLQATELEDAIRKELEE